MAQSLQNIPDLYYSRLPRDLLSKKNIPFENFLTIQLEQWSVKISLVIKSYEVPSPQQPLSEMQIKKMFLLIVEKLQDVNGNSINRLTFEKLVPTIKTLIKEKFDLPNDFDKNFLNYLLYAAVEKNYLFLIKIFLSQGADPDAKIYSSEPQKNTAYLKAIHELKRSITALFEKDSINYFIESFKNELVSSLKKLLFSSSVANTKLWSQHPEKILKKIFSIVVFYLGEVPPQYLKELQQPIFSVIKEKFPLLVDEIDSACYLNYLFYAAIKQNNLYMVEVLLQLRVNLNQKVYGHSIFYYAIKNKCQEIIDKFLQSNQITADAIDRHCLLFLAVKTGDLAIIKKLIAHGANVNVLNEKQNNLLAYAATPDIANYLIEQGLRIDKNDCSGLINAICNNNITMVKYLLAKNIKVDSADLLYYAINNRVDNAIVQALLDAGAPINTQRGILKLAVEQDNVALVTLLLAAGADVNFPIKKNHLTPLGEAVFNRLHCKTSENKLNVNAVQIIKLLLRYGADINIVSPKTNKNFMETIKQYPTAWYAQTYVEEKIQYEQQRQLNPFDFSVFSMLSLPEYVKKVVPHVNAVLKVSHVKAIFQENISPSEKVKKAFACYHRSLKKGFFLLHHKQTIEKMFNHLKENENIKATSGDILCEATECWCLLSSTLINSSKNDKNFNPNGTFALLAEQVLAQLKLLIAKETVNRRSRILEAKSEVINNFS